MHISVCKANAEGLLQGEQVDSNMVATYKAAKAAGINSIDACMFPCKSWITHTKLFR